MNENAWEITSQYCWNMNRFHKKADLSIAIYINLIRYFMDITDFIGKLAPTLEKYAMAENKPAFI